MLSLPRSSICLAWSCQNIPRRWINGHRDSVSGHRYQLTLLQSDPGKHLSGDSAERFQSIPDENLEEIPSPVSGLGLKNLGSAINRWALAPPNKLSALVFTEALLALPESRLLTNRAIIR